MPFTALEAHTASDGKLPRQHGWWPFVVAFLRCRTDSDDRSCMGFRCHTACRMSIAPALFFSTVVHVDLCVGEQPIFMRVLLAVCTGTDSWWYLLRAHHATHHLSRASPWRDADHRCRMGSFYMVGTLLPTHTCNFATPEIPATARKKCTFSHWASMTY